MPSGSSSGVAGAAPVISPIAVEAVKRIDAIFDAERIVNGRSAEERLAGRRELTAPLIDDLGRWLRDQAMALTPDAWSALAEDERTEILVEPFATFVDLDEIDHGPVPDNIDEIRQGSADLIPRVLPALRKLAQMRAERPQTHAPAPRKTGRNQPCPCGSGKKYKRCCGLN